MRKFVAITIVLAGMLLVTAGASGDVSIDFETLPDGTPAQQWDPVADSYAEWGISFSEIGYGTGQPLFWVGYNADGFFAWTRQCGGYPPGFNIKADFSVPVYEISTDVMTAAGYTVTMTAKDAAGVVIGTDVSDPAPSSFWAGTLSITTDTPIASVEWWPSAQNAGVGIDNLFFSGGAACPGDVDGDGDTDLSDLAALLAAYGTSEGDPGYNPAADFDDSGAVDLTDLAFLLSDYGCGA